jgi:lipopolysaccharide export system protein LptA
VNKYFFSLIFLLITCTVVAQKKSTPVHLDKSETAFGSKENGKDLIKAYKAIFRQETTTLTSDSAYFHPQDNTVEAFGHVVIIQGDTLHIYADKLNYNGNTKIAILTDNVKMVDKDAVLTTNYFVYNTGTKIGTYTGGGKLINKDNTLVSKTGYYFSSSRDAYFRYNVVLKTPDAVIKTDTMRYNSGTRITYFYGPTNIYGKDKDTLYTENGTYNTETEQALFGKHNLYKKGTKSLTGDSLFYDRAKGYGRATKHVTFMDTEQKVILKGDLGVYTRDDERTVVTEHPYVILITEDSVKTDTAKKSQPVIKADAKDAKNIAPVKDAMPVKALVTDKMKNPKDTTKANTALKKLSRLRRDSIFISGDTIQTMIVTYHELKILQESMRIAGLRDTSIKMPDDLLFSKPPKFLSLSPPKLFRDTDFTHPNYFPKKPKTAPVKRVSKIKPGTEIVKVDSVYLKGKVTLSDTSRVRILIAAHHAKIFKSDLQAVADSIFYSYVDSTVRMFGHPMIWAEHSQLSGDTINLQMKNKKIDNVEMFPRAMIVNIDKQDSTSFNQIGGRKMRGFFKDGKINVFYVDGNAETIFYKRDSLRVTNWYHSISSRIRVNFKNSEVKDVAWYVKPEEKYSPIAKVKEENKILKNFIWKPKDRPVSKESVISPPDVKRVTKKPAVKKTATVKKAVIKPGTKAAAHPKTAPVIKTDSVKTKMDTIKRIKLDTGKIK